MTTGKITKYEVMEELTEVGLSEILLRTTKEGIPPGRLSVIVGLPSGRSSMLMEYFALQGMLKGNHSLSLLDSEYTQREIELVKNLSLPLVRELPKQKPELRYKQILAIVAVTKMHWKL